MCSAPDPAKQQLRAELLALRRGLTAEQIVVCSRSITDRLVAHPLWAEARGLAAFVGVRNEPDTIALLERSIAASKDLWLPRLTGPGRMQFWSTRDLATLEPGRMGLREPAVVGPGVTVPGPEQGVDLMLVPGLGFGRDGARIGFGAGHYDRALASGAAELRPILIGVCFAEFLDPFGREIPTEDHDVRVDWVLTEAGLERCTPR